MERGAFLEAPGDLLLGYRNHAVVSAAFIVSKDQNAKSARSKIRVMVRRILRSRGYPPDLQVEKVKLVLEQAETLCEDWAACAIA